MAYMNEARTLAQQFRFALTARANVGQTLLRAAAHGEDVVAPGENRELADVVFAAGRFHQVQHREQGIAVLFDLGPLMSDQCVLDCERVQVESRLQFGEFGRGRIVQRHPDKAIGPLQVLGYLRDRNVADFLPSW